MEYSSQTSRANCDCIEKLKLEPESGETTIYYNRFCAAIERLEYPKHKEYSMCVQNDWAGSRTTFQPQRTSRILQLEIRYCPMCGKKYKGVE